MANHGIGLDFYGRCARLGMLPERRLPKCHDLLRSDKLEQFLHGRLMIAGTRNCTTAARNRGQHHSFGHSVRIR